MEETGSLTKTNIYDFLYKEGFIMDNRIVYNKYIYNENRPAFSLDFGLFHVMAYYRFRIFFNDWSNWFDITSLEQLKTIYEFYCNKNISLFSELFSNLKELEDLGFTQSIYNEYIYSKTFDKFEMTVIQGYLVHVKFNVNPPYDFQLNHDYVNTKEDLVKLIEFYNKVL